MLNKYRELVAFAFFGGLTTLINFAVYAAADARGMSTAVSVTAAWLLSVSFAYATNRKWVFTSRAKGAKNVLREAAAFFAVRAGTYFMDLGIVWLFIDYYAFDDQLQKYGIKLGSNILVIIINFVLSKFIVFRRGPKAAEGCEKDGSANSVGEPRQAVPRRRRSRR